MTITIITVIIVIIIYAGEHCEQIELHGWLAHSWLRCGSERRIIWVYLSVLGEGFEQTARGSLGCDSWQQKRVAKAAPRCRSLAELIVPLTLADITKFNSSLPSDEREREREKERV